MLRRRHQPPSASHSPGDRRIPIAGRNHEHRLRAREAAKTLERLERTFEVFDDVEHDDRIEIPQVAAGRDFLERAVPDVESARPTMPHRAGRDLDADALVVPSGLFHEKPIGAADFEQSPTGRHAVQERSDGRSEFAAQNGLTPEIVAAPVTLATVEVASPGRGRRA